jgi:hypothetical protein
MSIKLLRHEFKKRAPLGTGVGSSTYCRSKPPVRSLPC